MNRRNSSVMSSFLNRLKTRDRFQRLTSKITSTAERNPSDFDRAYQAIIQDGAATEETISRLPRLVRRLRFILPGTEHNAEGECVSRKRNEHKSDARAERRAQEDAPRH